MIGENENLLNRQRSGSIFEFDFLLFLPMLCLMCIGGLFIYSSGVNAAGQLITREYVLQIIWITTALAIYILLQLPHYDTMQKLSIQIYVGLLLLLIITLLFGKTVKGARSWLGLFGFGIQPSEFMKIGLIIALASFFQHRKGEIGSMGTFLVAFLLTLLPMGLILLQPDMGTALVYIPLFLVISFIAGVNRKALLFLFLFGLLTVLFAVIPVWENYILQQKIRFLEIFRRSNLVFFTSATLSFVGLISFIGYRFAKRRFFLYFGSSGLLLSLSLLSSYLFRIILKDYQIMRLIVFIKPEVDPQGSGWHIIQSLTAVGSGGLWGKGFLEGTQSHYQFLPEQSTDFIFSIIAEEWGFIGSFVILALFSVILVRGLIITLHSGDDFGVFVGAGVIFMIFFHLVINIGMAIGIMPITGIPLFFLSYGGSSLWTATIGLSLIQNIHLRRYKY